jgi:protein tyrosine phosphatase
MQNIFVVVLSCFILAASGSSPMQQPNQYTVKFSRPVTEPPSDSLLDYTHPLVKASSEILQTTKSDKEHNDALVNQGLTVHPGSRANNVIPRDIFDKLEKEFPYSKNRTAPMNGRMVQVRNLYQLKSGPRAGSYLGANLIDFSQYGGTLHRYIATEAPFYADDYWRMVIDQKSQILVSLTTEDDNKITFPALRGNIPIDLHHLKKGEKVEIDDRYIIQNEKEEIFQSSSDQEKILIKHLKVTDTKDNSSYLIHHIIYRDWYDGKLVEHPQSLVNLLQAIDYSEGTFKLCAKIPIIVNCGYGYGRTAVVILAHQIHHMLTLVKNTNIDVELEPMLYSLQDQLAYKALVGADDDKRTKYQNFKTLIEYTVKALVAG